VLLEYFKINRKGEYNKTCLKCAEARKHKRDIAKIKKTDQEGGILDIVLKKIAKNCIEKNYYRRSDSTEEGYYFFTVEELKDFNNIMKIKKKNETLCGGYTFLDEKDGKEGMIRLYSHKGQCNPKWSFWMEDGKLKVDFA